MVLIWLTETKTVAGLRAEKILINRAKQIDFYFEQDEETEYNNVDVKGCVSSQICGGLATDVQIRL